MTLRSLSILGVIAAGLLGVRPAVAQQSDVIRGRVTDGEGRPIPEVRVTATSYAGGITKEARTNRDGRFTIAFINGEGDYWLSFTAIGFVARRFEVKRVGDEEILIANTTLTSAIASLDAVNVIAPGTRALVNRAAPGTDVGGGDRPLTNGVLPPDQAGNLAAMASAIVGMQLIPGLDGAPDVFSALGLSGDQNNITFNGLGSGINMLPPDAQVRLSLNAYPWDVARGGFSGAQITISSVPGSNYSFRNLSSGGTGPGLEWVDATANATGQKSTRLQVGGAARGPIARDKEFYNASYLVSRAFSDAPSLLDASSAGLAAAGVAHDSVARLLDILHQRNVPVTVASAPRLNATDNVRLQGNVDFAPSASGTGHALTLAMLGGYAHVRPAGVGGSLLTAVPARAGDNERWTGSATVSHSNYFWFGILSRSAVSYAENRSSTVPYLAYPQGSVRVSSDLPDGGSAVRWLSFGGGAPPTVSRSRMSQVNNELSWYTNDNKHTLKLTSGVSREENVNQVNGDGLGIFSFNSLADLEVGSPASFDRTLSRRRALAAQLTGNVSLGDAWRPAPTLQIQYGLRLDGNRFLNRPDFNPVATGMLGARNDVVPNRIYASPRAGLQWHYGKAPQIAYTAGAARPPRAVVHAGVGVFQNVGPASLISPAVGTTGLPSSTQSVSCVGAAAPVPEWSTYFANPSAIPTECADGTRGSELSTSAPSVVAFDRRFEQPRAFRMAADWSGPVLDNRFALGLQVVSSWNMNQVGSVDLNLNPISRFSLDDEAGRPVFADPGEIVPGTGTVAAAAARRFTSFHRLTSLRSDLRSVSRQLVVKIVPVTVDPRLRWDLTYSWLAMRDQFYGFSSTVGDPFERQWGTHLASGRHHIMLNWSAFPVFDLVYVSAAVHVKSGARFTPMINGDVNADGGFANDRAFVFDPASAAAADASVAASMQSLLVNGARPARDCLVKQLDRLAERGSCRAPWFATTALRVTFNPQKIGLPKRASLALSVTNPLGIADVALHGNARLRGWGQEIQPDQNLLFVRGFDPATHRFRYEVNQRFGSTRPQQAVQRNPAYISLSLNLDLGAPRERQLLDQRLDIGRSQPGEKQSASTLRSLGTSTIPNPMSLILQQPESLQLSRVQADSLALLSRRFTLHADSIWAPVSLYLESLPASYSHADAYRQYVEAREQTMDFLIGIAPDVRDLLTAAQRRRLPPQILNYLDIRVLKFLRSSTGGVSGSP